MKAIAVPSIPLALVILALVISSPCEARPRSRCGRQDLRMLPANATGTPQDQALASGVVPAEAPASAQDSTVTSTMPPARTSDGWRKLTSSGHAAPLGTSGSQSGPGATPGTSGTPGTPGTALPSGPPVSPAFGQDRAKGHPGMPADFPEDSNIVFPSHPVKHDTSSNQGQFDPFARNPARTPACAKGSTFCTDVDNYPENYLQTMLRSAAIGLGLKEYFGNDVIAEGNITQRIDANDENPLCPYEETVVYPKVAKNKEDKWLYVVNQDHFVQGVRIETCLNQGTACQLAENFPYGYTTSCRQKYILRKLVALNPEGQTQTDMFRLPSCCSCYVTRSNVSSRRSNVTPTIKKTGSRRR